jgi:hypothetical protein
MQFQVPQFIETESKIIWFLSLRQFFYIAASLAIVYILFFSLEFFLWVIIAPVVAGVGVSLALIKINGRSMPYFLSLVFGYFWSPKVYLLREPAAATRKPSALARPSSLKELFQKITTSSSPIPKRESSFLANLSQRQAKIKERYELLRKITGEKEVARRIDYR